MKMELSLINVVLSPILFSIIALFCLCILLVATTQPFSGLKRSEEEKYFLNKKNGEKTLFPSFYGDWSVSLSVIVPSYNEEKRLPLMLDECIEFLEDQKKNVSGFTYEVIIVSDGSKDCTVDVGLKYTEKYGSDAVRVLALNPNRGKGGAVCLGVECSRGALILFADADGATKFKDLIKLNSALFHSLSIKGAKDTLRIGEDCCESAIMCGSRAHLEEESIATRSFFRTFLMNGFHFLVWFFAVRSVKDTQCGFKLFTRKAAQRVFPNLHVQGWAFDVELLYIAEYLSIPIQEISVNWTEIEGSKIVPVLSWLQMGKDLLLIWLRYKIGAWKIRTKSD